LLPAGIELGSRGEALLLDREHSGRITALAFGLEQPLFVTRDEHGLVLLRDLETGNSRARLQAHGAAITAACICPDGQLVTAAKDRTVKVWNIQELGKRELISEATQVRKRSKGGAIR
jgi:WD40 repeat protein